MSTDQNRQSAALTSGQILHLQQLQIRRFLCLAVLAKAKSEYLDLLALTYFYGARYYDPRVSVWISADPALGEYMPKQEQNAKHDSKTATVNGQDIAKLPGRGGVFTTTNVNLYQYAGLNPLTFVDADGEEVRAFLSLSKNTLTLIDFDTKQKIIVQAFSGGHVDRKTNKIASPGTGEEIPAPKGEYFIIDNPNVKPGTEDWFGLAKNDERIDDYTMEGSNERSGIRLHKGSISHGCATVCGTQPQANKKWSAIKQMLQNTKKGSVDFTKGPHWWNPTDKVQSYGTLEIVE